MNVGVNKVLCFMQLSKAYGFSIYGQDLKKVIEIEHELRKKQ